MQNPIQMTLILLSYVFFVLYVGPRFMANRKPYDLKTPMVIYNFSMVLFNALIVYEVGNRASLHSPYLLNSLLAFCKFLFHETGLQILFIFVLTWP